MMNKEYLLYTPILPKADMLNEEQNASPNQLPVSECPVCFEDSRSMFQISNCPHKFCRACCLSYIEATADNFAATKCLQDGCNRKLDKKLPIYSFVPSDVRKKIERQERFQFIQTNPQFRVCQVEECNGYFKKSDSQGRCVDCSVEHCIKCFKLRHEGACPQEDDEQMRSLNLRKCPNCRCWVEKLAGCDFIDCKCGCKFCFRCGNFFEKDPCRKGGTWKTNFEIKRLMSQLSLQKPVGSQQSLLFVPKLVLKVLLSLLVTPLTSVVAILILALFYALFSLFGPLVFCFIASEQKSKKKRWVIYGLIVLFYPLLIGLMAFLSLLLLTLYPCLRNTYHHGVYDPFDQGLTNISWGYLKVMSKIWGI